MATIKRHIPRGTLGIATTALVRLKRSDDEILAGTYVESIDSFVFEMDTTDADEYDSTLVSALEISTDDGETWTPSGFDGLNFGDAQATDLVTSHIGETTGVHGLDDQITSGELTNDVVGMLETQVLENKTIDGDDNVLSVKPSQLKPASDSALPAIRIKPVSDTDSELRINESDNSYIRLRASNAAETTARELWLKAIKVVLQDNSNDNLPIILDGIADATDDYHAVNKKQLDELAELIEPLIVGDEWDGTPTITVSVDPILYERGIRGIIPVNYSITWDLGAENENANRYQVLCGTSRLTDVVGAITAEQIQQATARAVINSRSLSAIYERQFSINWQSNISLFVYVIAYDITQTAYISAVTVVQPQVPVRDELPVDADTIDWRNIGSVIDVATAGTASSAASSLKDFLCDGTERVKFIFPFDAFETDEIIETKFYAKKHSTPSALSVKVEIWDVDGTPSALADLTRTLLVTTTAYDSNYYTIQTPVSGVLGSGKYQVRISGQELGTAASASAIRSDICSRIGKIKSEV